MPGVVHDARLTWIVVCHDSVRDLGVFLPSLVRALDDLDAQGLSTDLVIVDNASRDGSADLAARLAPRARIVRCGENVGYGAAVNRAAELARGAWLAFGNADLYVPRGGLAGLPRVLARAPSDVALVGPAIHNSDGSLGLSAGRFPSLLTLLAGLARACHRRKYLDERRHVPGPVDWLTGACLFARRDVFLAAGGFDPGFFLYYEDVDLARRVASGGHRTLYAPEVDVMHVRPHHGRPPQPNIEVIVRASRRRYFAKHRPRWETLMLGGLSRLEALVRPRSVRGARWSLWRPWAGPAGIPASPGPRRRVEAAPSAPSTVAPASQPTDATRTASDALDAGRIVP
ncbi:MAG: glycosyltransferase family 2 protein [Planctomycetes bacterium]|nr:glycosyltransferase family 2 protein [Planctomycetota bacterium]